MKNLLYTFVTLLLFTSISQTEIISIDTITDSTKYLAHHLQNSLILIDIDDTIMIAEDKIMRNANISHHNHFMDNLKKQPNADILIDTVFQNVSYKMVEPTFAKLIKSWHQDAYAVYGFTARGTGQFILSDTIENWVAKKMKTFDITFTQSGVDFEYLKNGIIFCSAQPKGDVLQQLLHILDHIPPSIIVFDDRMYNLKSVEEAITAFNTMHNTSVQFLGFHYKAVEYMDHTINHNVINKQLDHLIQHETYISEAMIKSEKHRVNNIS